MRASLASAQAEMSRLGGTSDARLWARAVAAWRETGRPHELAYALYRQTEAILAVGNGRAKAREYLPEAWQLASAAGAAHLLAAIEGLARRARLEVGQAPVEAASVDYGLTAREREVLALVAGGRTDRQIAEALFISPKTASVHVSNIKAKLGVEHRIEAAALGAGLVAAEDA
ncbi:MAG TPA: helix-turn-helix transcriptional regulator [Candidatus Limnocylindria bacterium]|nr:helix-turn-helix transcriptional regulator [Candidatus Limnocylindria bacterium]